MSGHFPSPKRKTPQSCRTGVSQILCVFLDTFKTLTKEMNAVFIHPSVAERNRILGIVSGASEPLARKHRDHALREYQSCPKLHQWQKLVEAYKRHKHIVALLIKMEDAA